MMNVVRSMLRRKPAASVEAEPRRTVRVPLVRARFDSAQTTPDNARHWAAADGLSPNASTNAAVRAVLRNRARYEVANNSYAKGIVLTLANDTVGTGPRLQMLTRDPEANRVIEEAFHRWCVAVDVAGKLRTMRVARAESGEGFGVLRTNPAVNDPVQLDIRLVEADQVRSPLSELPRPGEADGIVFDHRGNPVEYTVMRRHPGDVWFNEEYDLVPASAMLHYFRADRPGQWRGVPDITPALPLFAQLRRYTLAVIAAAETAADYAAVIYSEAPPGVDPDEVEPMDTFDLEQRMATVLPAGWKLGQIKAEQPSTTYKEFKHEILNEIARCLNMPFNVAAGNSSGYNYASGRLDHQTYYKSIKVGQRHMETALLDRILRAWLHEAVLVEGLLPQSMRSIGVVAPHGWFWDGTEHVDPRKEAEAQAIRLSGHTTTLAAEYAKQGRDWEDELRQRAKELELMRELNLPMAPPPQADSADTNDDEEVGDEAEAARAAA